MALLNVCFHSEVLGKQVQMNVVLPQRSRGQIGMKSIDEKVTPTRLSTFFTA